MSFDRRQFLRSTGLGAGLWVVSPLVRGLVSEAFGQVAPKYRLVMWLDRNGTHDVFRPGPLTSGDGFSLGGYGRLDGLKSKMVVADQLFNPFNLHLHGSRWYLTARPAVGSGDADATPTGPTFDRWMAQHLSREDAVSSLNLRLYEDRRPSTDSADAAGQLYPAENDPVRAFDRLFGAFDGSPSDADAPRQARERLLGFLSRDVARSQGGLAAPERIKLDRYLTSIDELRTRIGRLATGGECRAPGAPNPAEMGDRNDVRPERVTAHLDIAAHALACRLSSVAVIRVNAGAPFLGTDIGSHQMWHGRLTDVERATYYDYIASQMLYLHDRLDGFVEGDRTVADQTLFLWLNSAGGSHHNGAFDAFAMTIGNPAGRLRTGQLAQLPTSPMLDNDPRKALIITEDERRRAPRTGRETATLSTADLFRTIAHALEVETPSFGDERLNHRLITEMLA